MLAHSTECNIKRYAGASLIALKVLIATTSEEFASNSYRASSETSGGNFRSGGIVRSGGIIANGGIVRSSSIIRDVCMGLNSTIGQPVVEGFNDWCKHLFAPKPTQEIAEVQRSL